MVFINHPTKNQTLALDLPPPRTTLYDLQLAVHNATGVPPSHQRLYSAALPLPPHRPALPLSALGLRPPPPPPAPRRHAGPAPRHPPSPTSTSSTPSRRPTAATPPAPTSASANYVPGLGRSATDFTTRSDIGPARAAPNLPDRSATAAKRLSAVSFIFRGGLERWEGRRVYGWVS